nr:reverse transcriptase domain-containing protein [Tanacetum cinerariifolium]
MYQHMRTTEARMQQIYDYNYQQIQQLKTSFLVVPERNPHQPLIPYPSRLNKEKLQDKADIQIHNFLQMFKKIHFNISFAEALAYMPKFAKMVKDLLTNKEKIIELANTPLKENYSIVLLKNDFILEEIKNFLAFDDLISPDVNDGTFDMEGDIRLIETLLNNGILNDLPHPLPMYEINEIEKIKTSIDDPTDLELKDLPPHLEYAFLEGTSKFPIIMAKDLKREEKEQLLKSLGEPDSCRTQKGGMIIITNENNELIPTRLVMGWRVCIDYQKLNNTTRKVHSPLSFMDQMLKRLAGNEFYCFLDGFSGYFYIPIDLQDHEKTTFTCHYGTFSYRRVPFDLCNALEMFQRCMVAILHDMIEKTMEVFMDDSSVFEDSFSSCLSHLDMMLKCTYLLSKMLTRDCFGGFSCSKNLISRFTIKKGVENLVVDHLNRLENPHQGDLVDYLVVCGREGSYGYSPSLPPWSHRGTSWPNYTSKKVFDSGFSGPPYITMPRTWSHTGIHFMGPLSSSRGNRILVAVDYLSKWVEAKELPTNDARDVVKFLKQLFSRFRTPRAIISNRGYRVLSVRTPDVSKVKRPQDLKFGYSNISNNNVLNRSRNKTTASCRLGRPVLQSFKGWRDIYGDHAVSCAGIIGIKHSHNVVRDTLIDIYYRSRILAGKEVDIGFDGGVTNHYAHQICYFTRGMEGLIFIINDDGDDDDDDNDDDDDDDDYDDDDDDDDDDDNDDVKYKI